MIRGLLNGVLLYLGGKHMENMFKTSVAVLGTVGSYLYGGWSPLLLMLLSFVVLDYITGVLAAFKEGNLSSKVGFRNIPKKIMIFALVAVGHLIDGALGESHIVRDSVIFFYLANEAISILENAGRTGLPVPEVLKNAITALKGKDNA